jgi:type IV pilus assembly protein PilC
MKKTQKELSPLEIKINAWVTSHLTRVPFVDKFLFIHHLQIMTKAGLSIMSSLEILAKEVENKKLKLAVQKIKADVESGLQLSQALEKHPNIFPLVYVSMIGAGETAGKLEDALTQVSDQMKKTQNLNSKVRGAMIYPAVIMVTMLGITCFVVFYIMPKILIMFDEMNAELPFVTKMLIAFTNFGLSYWWLIIIVIVGFIVGFIRLMKIYNFKRFIHKIMLRLPIFGNIFKKINLARFTLTLSSLLASTIPIVEAVKISSEVLKNLIYKEQLSHTAESLKQGETLSSILMNYPQTFPPMTTEMLMVGEQSGKIEQMLFELSEYYNKEVEETMNNFTSIIEPVIILLLGLGVAGIAVAVIMPMYSLAQSI